MDSTVLRDISKISGATVPSLELFWRLQNFTATGFQVVSFLQATRHVSSLVPSSEGRVEYNLPLTPGLPVLGPDIVDCFCFLFAEYWLVFISWSEQHPVCTTLSGTPHALCSPVARHEPSACSPLLVSHGVIARLDSTQVRDPRQVHVTWG